MNYVLFKKWLSFVKLLNCVFILQLLNEQKMFSHLFLAWISLYFLPTGENVANTRQIPLRIQLARFVTHLARCT